MFFIDFTRGVQFRNKSIKNGIMAERPTRNKALKDELNHELKDLRKTLIKIEKKLTFLHVGHSLLPDLSAVVIHSAQNL